MKEFENLDEVLQHYGVKGMKWGVRRDASYRKGMRGRDRRKLKKMTSEADRKKYLDSRDEKWLSKVKDSKNAQKVAKATAKDMRKVNKELKKEYGGDVKRAFDRQAQARFQREAKAAYEDIVSAHTFKVYGMSPTRTREVEIQSSGSGTMKAVVVERNNPKLAKQRTSIDKAIAKNAKRESTVKHSAQNENISDIEGMFFIITMDEDGFPDDVINPFDFSDEIQQGDDDIVNISELTAGEVIQHYGVKGMQWGVRRSAEELAAANNEGGGGGGGGEEEEDEEFLEELGEDVKEALKKLGGKLSNIDDAIKKRGMNILSSIFGKSDGKATRKLTDKEIRNLAPKSKKGKVNGTDYTYDPKTKTLKFDKDDMTRDIRALSKPLSKDKVPIIETKNGKRVTRTVSRKEADRMLNEAARKALAREQRKK